MSARADALRFVGQKLSFDANPRLFRAKHYLAALREVTPQARLFIVPHDVPRDMVFDLQDERIGRDVFVPDAGPSQ